MREMEHVAEPGKLTVVLLWQSLGLYEYYNTTVNILTIVIVATRL